MRGGLAVLVLTLAVGCASAALQIYPHPPGEPATDYPPDYAGVRCPDPGSSCVDVQPGSGEAAHRFARVTARQPLALAVVRRLRHASARTHRQRLRLAG